ncbi:Unannotated [Lentimonas sp. CC4]|nr:Unannotated [Lentimonas sp. CC4]CAA7168744.1 Unannotated [Lentimonas sp. CC21]
MMLNFKHMVSMSFSELRITEKAPVLRRGLLLLKNEDRTYSAASAALSVSLGRMAACALAKSGR